MPDVCAARADLLEVKEEAGPMGTCSLQLRETGACTAGRGEEERLRVWPELGRANGLMRLASTTGGLR